MEEKKSFVLYTDYREHLALLSDSERGQLFSAIFDYQIDGVLPSLPPAAQMAFSFIKAQIDKDTEKYAETVRNRSEAGKKSAAKKQQVSAGINKSQQEPTDRNKSQQTATNSNTIQQTSTDINRPQQEPTNSNKAQQSPTNSTDNDNENVNENDNVNVSYNPPYPPRGDDGENQNNVYLKRFDEFWAAYPRKIGKDAALKAFKKRKPSAELLGKMISAIENQKHSVQWNRDNGQFIPNPATWINQGRWEDELPEPSPNPNTGQQPQQGSRNPFINAMLNGGGDSG